jgi:hypothetical protein
MSWTMQLLIICVTVLTMFCVAAYLAYSSISSWGWFLIAALAISAGFDFKESDDDDDDDITPNLPNDLDGD